MMFYVLKVVGVVDFTPMVEARHSLVEAREPEEKVEEASFKVRYINITSR
jgi:hypothetical protein